MTLLPTPTLAWRDALDAGRTHEALRLYMEEPERDEATLDALDALATLRAHVRGKRWGRALQSVRSVEPAPAWFDAAHLTTQVETLVRSAELLDRRDLDGARDALDEVREPALLAEVATQRGTLHVFLGETDDARASFERALDLDPKHFRAITNLGNLALDADRLDEAIAMYERALALDEEFANAHHNLGVAYRKKGEVGKSITSLKRAQRAQRIQDREAARVGMARVRKSASGRFGFLKWAAYGAAGMAIFIWLSSQGVF